MAKDRQWLQEAAKAAEARMPDQTGFVLFGTQMEGPEKQRLFYVSNPGREDALNSLAEWLAHQMDDEGNWMAHS